MFSYLCDLTPLSGGDFLYLTGRRRVKGFQTTEEWRGNSTCFLSTVRRWWLGDLSCLLACQVPFHYPLRHHRAKRGRAGRKQSSASFRSRHAFCSSDFLKGFCFVFPTKLNSCPAWLRTPLILVLGRQEDLSESTERVPGQLELPCETLSQTHTQSPPPNNHIHTLSNYFSIK